MEQLIELRQIAKIDKSTMDREYQSEDLVPRIMALQKKQQRLLHFKTLSSILLLVALVIVFLNRISLSVYSIMGIGIFISSVLTIVVMLNRLRFRITYEERTLSTLQLAELAESKIRTERKIFTSYLPVFAVIALTGFNLMYFDFFSGEEISTRFLYHLGITTSTAIAFLIGLTIRIKRFRKQFLPLQDRIRKFKSETSNNNL